MDEPHARVLEFAPRPPRGGAARRGCDRGCRQIFETKHEKETQMNQPVTVIEPGTVKLQRLLPGPLERVWAYITESDKRAKWLAAGEVDPRLGGKIHLQFDHRKLSCERTAPQKDKDRQLGKVDG